ncbi:SPASM domain-containing protein [Mycoplasmatota bacterium]|nr:SPASM domain-containing protein [Mycoplasmatota bacterium]
MKRDDKRMLSIVQYKPSIYNICIACEHDDYQWIIANTFSGGIMSSDNELKNFLFDFNKERCDYLASEQPEMYEHLIKQNFLVTSNLNEVERLKIRFQHAKYNERSMHLTILPTIDCNLDCFYCYEKNRDESMTSEIIRKLKDFVKERIGHLSNLSVTWYGGEPLLQAGTIEELSRFFIEKCVEKNVSYKASMITNGTLLTEDMVDLLIRCKVERLQVTVDGPKDIHNNRRYYKYGSNESFNDIIRGLRACQGKLPVNIRVNVDYTNIEYFKDIIDYLKINGLLGSNSMNGVSLGLVKEWTSNVKMDSNKMLSLKDFKGRLEELNEYLKEKGIYTGASYSFIPQTPCGAVNILNYLITPNGKLSKCWIHSTENNEEVGDIEDGLNLSNATSVTWTAYDPTLDKVCAECEYLPVCTGGCPYEMVNNLVDKEEHCKYTYQSVHDNLISAVKIKYN